MKLFGKSNKKLQQSNKAAAAALAKAQREENEKFKLLLLGAGESGKSTIFKQLRILYNPRPFSDEEKRQFTQAVYQYIIRTMKQLVVAVDMAGDKVEDTTALELINSTGELTRIDPTIGDALASLWNDPEVQKQFARRGVLQIPESIRVFMQDIDRIKDINFVATSHDHLYVRERTTGVIVNNYVINGVRFEMYDVGGQRNERRKWIHCFEGVRALIFVAALSEFDQALFEDKNTNRMTESLDLFQEVCGLKYFTGTSIILFLNKYDLFQEKLKEVSLAKCVVMEKQDGRMMETYPWGDYKGANDPISARDYFKNRFIESAQAHSKAQREIYFHTTTATDTGNVKFVFNACTDIILEQNMGESGLM